MNMEKRIGELMENDRFSGYCVISDIQLRTAKSGRPYLSAVLSDAEDSIDAKMWDYGGPVGREDNARAVWAQGTVTEFNGALQITLSHLRLTDERDAGKFAPEDLVPSAPIDADAALASVRELVSSIGDPDYRKAAECTLSRHQEAFRTIPAAKSVHHDFLAGLLMHTANMMRAADYLADLYAPVIDRSLLLAGTLLHDFAKEQEFSFSELGLVRDYSVSGDLLGHLYLGAREVADVCRELGIPEEKSILLQHMILSHHGEPEYGACVRPRCAESELLSLIDRMDSRMEIYAKALSSTPEGSFSPPVYAIGKSVYRHALPDEP